MSSLHKILCRAVESNGSNCLEESVKIFISRKQQPLLNVDFGSKDAASTIFQRCNNTMVSRLQSAMRLNSIFFNVNVKVCNLVQIKCGTEE